MAIIIHKGKEIISPKRDRKISNGLFKKGSFIFIELKGKYHESLIGLFHDLAKHKILKCFKDSCL